MINSEFLAFKLKSSFPPIAPNSPAKKQTLIHKDFQAFWCVKTWLALEFFSWQVVCYCRDTDHWALLLAFWFVLILYRNIKFVVRCWEVFCGQHQMRCGLHFGVSFVLLLIVLGNCNLHPEGPSTSVFVEQCNSFSYVASLRLDAVHLSHRCKAGSLLKLCLWSRCASRLEIYLFLWLDLRCICIVRAEKLFHEELS